MGTGFLAGDQRLGAGDQVRVADQPGEIAQGVGHVLYPVEAAFEIRDAEMLLHLARDVQQRLGADHHVDPGAVHGLHLGKARIARQGAEDAIAEFVEQRRDMPELAGDVVFADQVDVVSGQTIRAGQGGGGFAGADHMLEHRLAGQPVAEVLGAIEAGRIDRHHRHAPALAGGLAHGLDIVTDQCGDAGVVDEHRGRRVAVDRLLDRMKQALLATAHDHVGFRQVGGHADPVQHRARRAGAAVVPRRPGAGDRAMHDVGDIGDRQQRDLRAIEGTAAGRGAGFGPGAAGLFLVVVAAGRFVEQGLDFAGFHLGRSSYVRSHARRGPCPGR